MTENFVAYWLLINYPLIIGNNQWPINWLPIDYSSITLIDFIDDIDEICLVVLMMITMWFL